MTRHGISRYAMGCRCDICRAAKREYSTAWRRDHGIAPPGNPVRHNGVTYESQAACARALGVQAKTIAYHLNTFGDLSRLGKRKKRRPSSKDRFLFGYRFWDSRKAFAEHVGIPERTVRHWVAKGQVGKLLMALEKADAKTRRKAA